MYLYLNHPPIRYFQNCLLLYLTYSAGEYFKKLALKKKQNAALNRCISKARANSESKLTFSESSFNFLQNRVVFCTLYPRGYTAADSAPYNPRCRCQRLAGLKELMMSQQMSWICSFLSIFFETEEKLSKNCIFLLLDQSNPFT